MRHRRSGLSTYGLNSLRQGDEHPTYVLRECGTFSFTSTYDKLCKRAYRGRSMNMLTDSRYLEGRKDRARKLYIYKCNRYKPVAEALLFSVAEDRAVAPVVSARRQIRRVVSTSVATLTSSCRRHPSACEGLSPVCRRTCKHRSMFGWIYGLGLCSEPHIGSLSLRISPGGLEGETMNQ